MISPLEYRISSGVFGAALPHPARILITDAAGLNGRPFTMPTSLIPAVLGMNPVTFLPAAIGGYLGSVLNLAYLINAGKSYNTLVTSDQRLLIHEGTHVWQGRNSTFAMTYVFNSVLNQGIHGAGAYS